MQRNAASVVPGAPVTFDIVSVMLASHMVVVCLSAKRECWDDTVEVILLTRVD